MSKRGPGWKLGRPRHSINPPDGWKTLRAFLREVIAYARENRQLTALAEYASYSRQDLYRVEKGDFYPSPESVRKMARWLAKERRSR